MLNDLIQLQNDHAVKIKSIFPFYDKERERKHEILKWAVKQAKKADGLESRVAELEKANKKKDEIIERLTKDLENLSEKGVDAI